MAIWFGAALLLGTPTADHGEPDHRSGQGVDGPVQRAGDEFQHGQHRLGSRVLPELRQARVNADRESLRLQWHRGFLPACLLHRDDQHPNQLQLLEVPGQRSGLDAVSHRTAHGRDSRRLHHRERQRVYGFFTYPTTRRRGSSPTFPPPSLWTCTSTVPLTVSATAPCRAASGTTPVPPQNRTWRQLLSRPGVVGHRRHRHLHRQLPVQERAQAPSVAVNGRAATSQSSTGTPSRARQYDDRHRGPGRFLCGALSNVSSQFVYERSTGTPVLTTSTQAARLHGRLAKFAGGVNDPAGTLFVL